MPSTRTARVSRRNSTPQRRARASSRPRTARWRVASMRRSRRSARCSRAAPLGAGSSSEHRTGHRGFMGQVSVTINGRLYRMACDDGQENHLARLAYEHDQRMRRLEEELVALQDARMVAADRVKATETAISAAFNSAAERIEKITKALNASGQTGVARG